MKIIFPHYFPHRIAIRFVRVWFIIFGYSAIYFGFYKSNSMCKNINQNKPRIYISLCSSLLSPKKNWANYSAPFLIAHFFVRLPTITCQLRVDYFVRRSTPTLRIYLADLIYGEDAHIMHTPLYVFQHMCLFCFYFPSYYFYFAQLAISFNRQKNSRVNKEKQFK